MWFLVSEQVHAHSHKVLTPPGPEGTRAPNNVERAATWLSLACAVHCLVVPLLGGVLPALGASQLVAHGSLVDTALTVFVVVSVALSCAFGYARHRNARVLVFAGLGLCLYLLGHALEESPLSLPLSILGALCLAGTSYQSARLAQRCEHDHSACDHSHHAH